MHPCVKELEDIRFTLLKEGKRLFVPSPGLKKWLLKSFTSEEGDDDHLRLLASRRGIDSLGVQLSLKQCSELNVDVVVVEVDKLGRCIGTGGGLKDVSFTIYSIFQLQSPWYRSPVLSLSQMDAQKS